tara:strand:+ start:8545 stop:10689 length:2145 start_codon:yes stop_codon:yes gene_type:complete
MGLKQLLADLSTNPAGLEEILEGNVGASSNILTLSDDYGLGNSGHTITFTQRNMPWGDFGASDNKPLITQAAFSQERFDDLTESPETPNDVADISRGGGGGFRRGVDYVRINKWMFGTTTGRGWQLKQLGLQLMNPRLNAPQTNALDTFTNSFTDLLGNGIKDPNQFEYNLGVNTGISTLLSGIAAIPRSGIIPTKNPGYIDAGFKPSQMFVEPDNRDPESLAGEKNRLKFLFDNKISGWQGGGADTGLLADIGLGGNQALSNALSSINKLLGVEGEELYSYIGGPGSRLGIGRTRIGRYVVSTKGNDGKAFNDLGFYSPTTYSGSLTQEAGIQSPNDKKSPLGEVYTESQPHNFLRLMSGGAFDNHHPFFNWNISNIKVGTTDTKRTYHRESRLGTGNPGNSRKKSEVGTVLNKRTPLTNKDGTINYKAFVPEGIDKVNALDIHKVKSNKFTDVAYRDLIRFRIEAIDNNSPSNALHSDVMLFRAILDDVSDNFSAEHNSFKYNGRAEEFYSYKGFKRNISVSFKVAAQSRHEMMPIYRKLNFLVSNTAPDYSSTHGRMMTPYVRLTVGSWMNRIPGVISSVGLKWATDYPWEINMDGPEDNSPDMLVLPHVLDVSLDFIPIHNFLPRKGKDVPFILPNHTGIDGNLFPEQQWLKDVKPEEGGDTTLNVVKKYLTKKPQARISEGGWSQYKDNTFGDDNDTMSGGEPLSEGSA